MAKCSQCLHWDACSMLFEMAIGRKPTANGNMAEEKCPHFKDKTINTNADRIRAMSDDELAKAIIDGWFGFGCDVCSECKAVKCTVECVRRCSDWLKQPAEDDHG